MISLFAFGQPDLLPSPPWAPNRPESIIKRLSFSWPLTVVLCGVILIYLIKVSVIDTCRNIKNRKNNHHLPTVIVQRSEKNMNNDSKRTKSYKMKANPRYKEVYVGLQQTLRKYTIQMGMSCADEIKEY